MQLVRPGESLLNSLAIAGALGLILCFAKSERENEKPAKKHFAVIPSLL